MQRHGSTETLQERVVETYAAVEACWQSKGREGIGEGRREGMGEGRRKGIGEGRCVREVGKGRSEGKGKEWERVSTEGVT